MPNVFGLEDAFGRLSVFDAEDDETAPLSTLDDYALAAEYLDSLKPTAIDTEAAQAFALKLAKACKMIEADVASLDVWAADIARRKAMRVARLRNLRAYLAGHLDGWGIKAKDAQISVWTAKTNPSVEINDVSAVPFEYVAAILKMPRAEVPEGYEGNITDTVVSKDAILAEFKETGAVPAGVTVIATRRHVVWR